MEVENNKITFIFIDGRHAAFRSKGESPVFDDQAIQQVKKGTDGFKFVLVFPSKSEQKTQYYKQLLQQEPLNSLTCLETSYNDISNTILTFVSQTQNVKEVVFVSHNLQLFAEIKINLQVKLILFSGFAQEFHKRRQLEESSYSKGWVDYHVNSMCQIIPGIIFIHTIEDKDKTNNKSEVIQNIGIYFDYGKMSQMNSYELIYAHYPYKFTPLDFRLPYDQIPYISKNSQPISILLHKFQDFFKGKTVLNLEMLQIQEKNFTDFINRFDKQICILDDTQRNDKIRSRIDFNEQIIHMLNSEDCKAALAGKSSQITVSTPKLLAFDPKINTHTDFLQEVIKNKLDFPVFVKTVEASSSRASHSMAVILNIESLQHFFNSHPMGSVPVIVQEMINHDGVINKIYTIGNYTEMQVRVSIPNITAASHTGKENEAIWFFDSQKSFKEQLPIHVPDKLEYPHSRLDYPVVSELSQMIRKYFQLNLFGYDIVQRTGTQEYYIVDINYFPGFKNFKDLVQKFENLYQESLLALNSSSVPAAI